MTHLTESGVDGDPAAAAARKLEKEIAQLQHEISEAVNKERYRKNIFFPLALVVSIVFTLASLWAFLAYDVVIWAVFFFVGIIVSVVAALGVRMQNRDYKEQTRRLEEMIKPYRIALERKQSELSRLHPRG